MPAILTVNTITDEYIRVRVSGKEQGSPADPTADIVEFALMDVGTDPDSPDWIAGEWETDSTVTPNRYWARIQTSNFSPALDTLYDFWVRWFDNPETPVRLAGGVKFTN